jgi:uncharacterized protein (TIGR03086 family)
MDDLQAINRATDEFEARLAVVTGEQLPLTSTCEGWSVGQLLQHVAGGSKMAVELVGGASREDAALFINGPIGEDPVSECRKALQEQRRVFTSPIDRDQVVHHPMGDIPVSQLYEFRIMDLLIHAWDLARSLGLDEGLPDELVEYVHTSLKPVEPFIADIGVFGPGPSGNLGGDESLQAVLLDLVGRRP